MSQLRASGQEGDKANTGNVVQVTRLDQGEKVNSHLTMLQALGLTHVCTLSGSAV